MTRLRPPGLLLRALARSTGAAEDPLRSAINWMRAQWHEQPPIALRKP